MRLQDIKGVGPKAAERLRGAGINRVSDLATLNVEPGVVAGISTTRLRAMKKEAQKALYDNASLELKMRAKAVGVNVAQTAAEWEAHTKAALERALLAARAAESWAIEAYRASVANAPKVALGALERTEEAHAEAKTASGTVLDNVAAAPKPKRKEWEGYAPAAHKAARFANSALEKAKRAASGLGTEVREEAIVIGGQTRSFYMRLKKKVRGPT